MKDQKWLANRIGLVNFWYYDDQVFEFSNGRMLLRGANGSGKSVTMQSVLPVLLDGRTEPSRLDSFKSKDRRMEDYLLGEEQISGINERTGYLFMEFKRQDAERYITIGIGLQAKRGSALSKWYFGITDGRRVGEDFSLYDELSGGELQPLSKRQLINRLADSGKVMSSRKEYQAFVNDRLFGFSEAQQFEDCLALLIQLRSPKLSRDFSPTSIYSILTSSLPELKEDDLLPVSRSLEQIDESRQRLEQLEREEKAVQSINKSYRNFYQEKLRIIAHKWQEAERLRKQRADKIQDERQKENEIQQTLQKLEIDRLSLEHRINIWRTEQKDLEQNEHYQLVAKGEELKSNYKSALQNVEKWEEQLESKNSQYQHNRAYMEQLQLKFDEHVKRCHEFLVELADHAEESGFQRQHKQHLADFERLQEHTSFDYWQSAIRTYREHLRLCQNHLQRMEQLQQEIRELDKQLGDCNEKLEKTQQDERHWKAIFMEEKERTSDLLIEWHRQAPFELPETQFQEVFRRLEGLYERTLRFQLVLDPIFDAKNEQIQKLNDEIIPNRAKQKQLEQEIDTKQREIIEWLKEKDPVPVRTAAASSYRSNLKNDAYPLYSCIDFQEHVQEEECNRIEGALLESGILDALVSDKHLQLQGDRQILPQPLFFKTTLLDYLKVDLTDQSVDAGLITDLLQSVEMMVANDKVVYEGPAISIHGAYQLENIVGICDENYQASYIGKASRERFRKEQIEKLEVEKTLLVERLHDLQAEEKRLLERESLLHHMMDSLPKESELLFAYNHLDQAKKEVALFKEEVERHQNHLERRKIVHSSEFAKVMEITKDDVLEKTLDVYEAADKCFTDYQDAFRDWKGERTEIQARQREIKLAKERLEQLEDDLENQRSEVNEATLDAEKLAAEIVSNQELQQLNEVEKIKERIENGLRKLRKGKEQLNEFQDEKIKLMKKESINQNDLKRNEEQYIFEEPFAKLWHNTFEAEWRRYQTGDFDGNAIAEGLTAGWTLVDKRMITLSSNFDEAYRINEGDLLDYRSRINQVEVIEAPDWLETFDNDQFRDKIEVWQVTKQMKVMEVNTDGAWRNPDFLEQSLASQIEEVNLVLQRSDEELFEEIIFHSVGNILRALIKKGQRWVEKMNTILLQQDNSSGLALSLKWKAKAAETEDVLSTSELVKLLLKDTSILKDHDIEQIKYYFQEKIKQAKIKRDESDDYESLYQVLQEVLDYRQWFSFELHYSKGFPKKIELTNTRFNRFSGGEKAIAMYLPLFTAMYSRYQDANDDAPYLITLDEAFAGIDDLNIAELFKAMEQLGFNYIINSQALYGEYETVTSINTYELIRPLNGDSVSTLLYRWDGKGRISLLPGEELMGDGE